MPTISFDLKDKPVIDILIRINSLFEDEEYADLDPVNDGIDVCISVLELLLEKWCDDQRTEFVLSEVLQMLLREYKTHELFDDDVHEAVCQLGNFFNTSYRDMEMAWLNAITQDYTQIRKFLPFIEFDFIRNYGEEHRLLSEKGLTLRKEREILTAILLDPSLNPALGEK